MTESPDALDRLAEEELDDVDERILADIAGLYAELDPVPGGLVDRIRFGITLDALHAEIAELERGALVGARSEDATTAQTITFTSASLSLVITVSTTSAERARLDGWLAGAPGAAVDLRCADGTVTATADEDGRFVLADVARGMAQFVVRPVSGNAVLTPSFEI